MELDGIVRETMALTGSNGPALLEGDAPVLDSSYAAPFYVVGLIGGKEVGKSSIVNALVGEKISDETSFGRGTESVVAFAHRSVEGPLREMLEREARGEYRIVFHHNESLRRQVLVDLPDIDSRWRGHVQLVKRMLRVMLYPVWVTSVEKYADQVPQQMLKAVAEGNAAGNFLFCINKADQLSSREVEELRADYATRVTKLLGVTAPKVWAVSAHRPEILDFAKLKEELSSEKGETTVEQSREAAGRQRTRTLMHWLDQQDVRGRAERLERMEEEAKEAVATRIGSPLMELVIPGLLSDAGHRLALVNAACDERLKAWPIVNMLHVALMPIGALIARNLGAGSTGVADQHLAIDGRGMGEVLGGTFARLQQVQPGLAELYDRNRLWESNESENAVASLRSRMTQAISRQREEIREACRPPAALAPIRWLLTVGAILWFPFIQPVLQTVVVHDATVSMSGLLKLIVPMLGSAYLLQQVTFLAIYFVSMWIVLRWQTHRKVSRLLSGWSKENWGRAETSLLSAVMGWLEELVSPISRARERASRIVEKIDQYREAV